MQPSKPTAPTRIEHCCFTPTTPHRPRHPRRRPALAPHAVDRAGRQRRQVLRGVGGVVAAAVGVADGRLDRLLRRRRQLCAVARGAGPDVARALAGGAVRAPRAWPPSGCSCSRNDAIGNLAVMGSAFGVFGTGSAWPDLVVATGATGVSRQARA